MRAVQPFASRTITLPARDATTVELSRVHSAAHIDSLTRIMSGDGAGQIDADTWYSAGSWAAALAAAGGTVELATRIAAGELDNGFALVRPPGHHATRDQAMGFCFFNSIAVAAAALRARGLRPAIVDWDVHHGNGTQDIFYADADVLFVSLHEWPQYPGTGAAAETGVGAGIGATLNVPVPAGTDGARYLEIFTAQVVPRVRAFAPDIILVSAGFDAHRADPIGGLALDTATYAALTRALLAISPRLLCVLEGGYDLDALGQSVAAVLDVLVKGA